MSFKRVLALVLALTMVFSLAMPGTWAFAEEDDGIVAVEDEYNDEGIVEDPVEEEPAVTEETPAEEPAEEIVVDEQPAEEPEEESEEPEEEFDFDFDELSLEDTERFEAIENPAVKIGNMGYATVAEALPNSGYDTLMLQRDLDDNVEIEANSSQYGIVIDGCPDTNNATKYSIGSLTVSGGVVTLKNVTVTGNVVVSGGTLEILDSVINGRVTVSDGTVKLGTSSATADKTSIAGPVSISGGTVVMDGVNVTAKSAVQITDGTVTMKNMIFANYMSINITGGKLIIPSGDVSNFKNIEAGSAAEGEVKGGLFSEASSLPERFIAPGYWYKTADVGTTITVQEFGFARIGETGYKDDEQGFAALFAAMDAATSDFELVLLDDFTLTQTLTFNYGQNKKVTLNLNGHNVVAQDDRALWVKSGEVEITGEGTISTNENSNIVESSSVIRVGDSAENTQKAKLTVGQDVTVSSDKCYGITVFGNNNTDGDKKTSDIELVLNGKVEVSGNVSAVSGNGTNTLSATTVTINGEVKAHNSYAIYHPDKGTITINGKVEGLGGIEMKGGSLIVADDAIINATAQSEQIAHATNYNGPSTVGYAIAAVNNASYAGEPNVQIANAAVNGKTSIIADAPTDTLNATVTATAPNALTIDTTEYYWDEGTLTHKLVVKFWKQGHIASTVETDEYRDIREYVIPGYPATVPSTPSDISVGYHVVYRDKDQHVFNFETLLSTDTDIEAYAAPNNYTVQFNSDNGTGTMNNQSFLYDEAQDLTENAFTRTGYTFSGWATATDAEKKYEDKANVTNLTTENNGTVNLYAVWTPINYAVHFNPNDPNSVDGVDVTGTMDPQAFTYDKAKNLTKNEYQHTGYTFAGWATGTDAVATYTDAQSVSNLATETDAVVNLYATWTKNKFAVNFHYDNGTATATELIPYWTSINDKLPENLTRVGYTMGKTMQSEETGYWYMDEARTDEQVWKPNYVVNRPLDLYAAWTPVEFDVTFDANDPNTADGVDVTGQTDAQHFVYDVEQALNPNGFSYAAAYTFTGWNTKADGTGTSYQNGQTVKNLATNTDITLYAQWSANPFTVTLKTNGGEVATDTTLTVLYWSSISDRLRDPTKTGYTFGGWYMDEACSDGQAWQSHYVVNRNLTLYAKWTANTYEVVFDKNGGTGKDMASQTYTFDENAKALNKNTYKRTGYTFKGWATSTDAKATVVYQDRAKITLNDNTPGLNRVNPSGNKILDLYAVWQPITYTIHLEKGNENATGTMEDMTIKYDEYSGKTLPRNIFEFDGYRFKEWKDEENNATYTDLAPITDNMTATNGKVITLTAQWDALDAGIYFDAKGGTVKGESFLSVTGKTGDELDIRSNLAYMPIRPGYTFDGWYTMENGVEVKKLISAMPETMPSKPITYTAHWRVKDTTWTVAKAATSAEPIDNWGDAEFNENTIAFTNAVLNILPAKTGTARPADTAWIGVTFTAPAAVTDTGSELLAKVKMNYNGHDYSFVEESAADGVANQSVNFWFPVTLAELATETRPETKTFGTVKFYIDGESDMPDQTFTVTLDTANITLNVLPAHGDATKNPQIKIENNKITDRNVYYDVTFDSADGTAVAAQSVRWNQNATKPKAPTKEGKVFVKWLDGSNEFSFNTPITAAKTLTAEWRDADAYLVDKGNYTSYVATIDDATAWFSKHTDWYDSLHIFLNRDGVEYTLLKDKTLTIDLNNHELTVKSKNDVVSNTSASPFKTGLYYIPDPTTTDGLTTYSTAAYVAQVKTETYKISYGHAGEEIAKLDSTSYQLYKTFAEAAADALKAGTNGSVRTVKTIILLTANQTPYEITAANLAGDKKLTIDETNGTANVYAEIGNEIKSTVSGKVTTYWLEELDNTWTVEAYGAGMNVDPIEAEIGDNTITVSNATIQYSPVDTTIGRTIERAWFGVKFNAPAAVTATEATMKTATIRSGSNVMKFYDVKDANTYFYMWFPVDKAAVEANLEAGKITWPVEFDLKADGTYEQTINVVLNLNNIKLTDLTGDVTIEVKEKVIVDKNENHKVSFVTNNGTTVADATVRYNHAVTTLPVLTRNGYEFAGWYTDEALTKEFVPATLIKEDLTLYGAWSKPNFTMNYVLRGGTNAATNPATYNVDSGEIVLDAPTRQNWHFAGWTSPQLNQNVPTATLTIPANAAETIHDTLNIGARWTYNATFDTVGGTPAIEAQNGIAQGSKVTAPGTVTRRYYTFDGWFTGTKDENGVVTYGEKFDFETAPTTGDITLFAKWTGVDREISFIDETNAIVIQKGNQEYGKVIDAPTYAEVTALIGSLPANKYIDEEDMWSPAIGEDETVTVNRIYKLKLKNTLTVTFEANDAILSDETITGLHSGDFIPKAPAVTNAEGVEAKWLINGEAGKYFEFGEDGTPVTESMNLVATWSEEPVDEEYADFTYNMSLTDSLNMKYYVRNFRDGIDYKNFEVIVTIKDEEPVSFPLYSAEENELLIAQLDARRMTDNINVVVKYNDEKIKESNYTIKEYCEALLGSGSAKLDTLVKAVLAYGANAQLALNYPGELPTESYDVSGVQLPSVKATRRGQFNDVKNVGDRILVSSTITLDVMIELADGVNPETVKAYVDSNADATALTKAVGNWYSVSIPVSALRLDANHTVMVECENGDVAIYSGSALVPISRAGNDLTRALYNYFQAAQDYYGSL